MANAGTHGRKNFSFSTAVPLTTVTFLSHVNAGLRVNAVKIQLMLKRTQNSYNTSVDNKVSCTDLEVTYDA